MLFRTILMCLAWLVLVKLVRMDPMEILFKIEMNKTNGRNTLTCDHNMVRDGDKQKNKYTVLEGEDFKITTLYNHLVNHLICHVYKDDEDICPLYDTYKNNTTCCHVYKDDEDIFPFYDTYKSHTKIFKAEKRMSTLWQCAILTHKYAAAIFPVVQYRCQNYPVAFCYMKIHVRQTKSPHILVNNMVLQLVRTNLSERYIDFTAEYQYVDGDIVKVTCATFLNTAKLTMEYSLSDKFNSTNLSSDKAIGFVTKLHSEHNNTYMICTNTETNDSTKVMVKFIMSNKINIISVRINGMIVRPKVDEKKHSLIEYKYISNQLVNVTCEVKRADVKFLVLNEEDIRGKVSSYKRKDVIQDVKAEMSFILNGNFTGKFRCASDYKNVRGSAESVDIHFTEGDSLNDYYPLHMELPSNGTVMEIYTHNKLKIIYYEFNDGETVKLHCYRLFNSNLAGPLVYLHFNDFKQHNHYNVSQILHLNHQHHNFEIVCYMKEQINEQGISENDKVVREIKVIFRKRVLTTTTTATTEGTISNHTLHISSTASLDPAIEDDHSFLYIILAAMAGVTCIIIICIFTVIIKRRKRNHLQGEPHDRNYENLQTPSEASIPPYPPQWESNYAVPADRRVEDVTYSVPCGTEPAVYSTAVPKSQRKQIRPDSTYAILDVQNSEGRKNVFKETNDPNYSEVYVNRPEQCYAKVIPKSVRKKMEQDYPYSYVTNEPPYANTAGPEPMYCEPNIATKPQSGQYANINNTNYVNSPGSEYVEPTYCEPHKRGK